MYRIYLCCLATKTHKTELIIHKSNSCFRVAWDLPLSVHLDSHFTASDMDGFFYKLPWLPKDYKKKKFAPKHVNEFTPFPCGSWWLFYLIQPVAPLFDSHFGRSCCLQMTWCLLS